MSRTPAQRLWPSLTSRARTDRASASQNAVSKMVDCEPLVNSWQTRHRRRLQRLLSAPSSCSNSMNQVTERKPAVRTGKSDEWREERPSSARRLSEGSDSAREFEGPLWLRLGNDENSLACVAMRPAIDVNSGSC